MHDAIDSIRARIICAMEYLANARAALPAALLTDSAVAITGAQTALRQALRDLPDRSTAGDERRQEPRRLMENITPGSGRPLRRRDGPRPLDLAVNSPARVEPVAAATAWRA